MARLESEGYQAWIAARQADDFSKFAPVLQEWVELVREKCAIIDPTRCAHYSCTCGRIRHMGPLLPGCLCSPDCITIGGVAVFSDLLESNLRTETVSMIPWDVLSACMVREC